MPVHLFITVKFLNFKNKNWFWFSGVPSTLNYIPLDSKSTESPKLTPYPNWAYNKEGNCDGLTTTYRIKADSCNRLWVLNSGTVGIGKSILQSSNQIYKFMFI